MIKVHFNSKHCKLTNIQCYAPTNETESEQKEDWYEQLQQVVSNGHFNSDNHLVIAHIQVKLYRTAQRNERRKKLDITRLKHSDTNKKFVLELRNRFSALANMTEETNVASPVNGTPSRIRTCQSSRLIWQKKRMWHHQSRDTIKNTYTPKF